MPRRSVSNSGSRSPPRKARPPRRSPTPTQSPPKNLNNQQQQLKLYISGLPAHANKDELRSYFEEFGSITDIFVINKQSFSFGFITYDNPKSASEAKEAMTGKEIGGKSISCAYARPRPERSNGPRGGGGGTSKGRSCFKCGQEGHFARECPKAENEGNSRPPRRQFNSRNQSYNRQGDRNQNNRRSVSNSNSPKRKNNERKRSPSGSPIKKKHQGRRSRSGSSSPTKSPPKRRPQRRSSSSHSQKKRAPRHQRSRSAEMRKGTKRRVSPSSSGSRRR